MSRGRNGSQGPTLKDVANHAQVSLATASRALSGDHPMTAETRDRVLTAVEELGYRRNRKGRQSEPHVAIVASTLGHLVISAVVAGVEDASAHAGRTCTITVTHADLDREIATLEALSDDPQVGAVIVVGGVYPDGRWRRTVEVVAARLKDRGVLLVFCGRGVADLSAPGLTVLDYDNAGGSAAAIGVLAGRGHRSIGVIRGPRGFSTSDARQRGVAQAFADHGLPDEPSRIVEGPLSTSTGEDAVATLVAAHPDITAIFAESDTVALGAIRGARLLGLDLPEDLSIVGFDDMRYVDALAPALTTVHMPFAELGRRAARLALGEEPGGRIPAEVIFGTHVVMRESVGAPRTRQLRLGSTPLPPS